MDSEEEQVLGRSLLTPQNDDAINDYEEGSVNGNPNISSSSATFIVVLSTLVAVSGSYDFGSAVGYSSPAETGIVDDLGLTTAEYSVFGSMLTIGAMLSAILSGRIADLVGRRSAMGVSQLFCVTGWLAIAFSKGVWWLDIGRFLVGYGIGILVYVVPVYIAEISPKNVRGAFISLNQLMIGCGKAIMFLIGSLVHWRTLAMIGCFFYLFMSDNTTQIWVRNWIVFDSISRSYTVCVAAARHIFHSRVPSMVG